MADISIAIAGQLVPPHLEAIEALTGERIESVFPLALRSEPAPKAAVKRGDAFELRSPGEYAFDVGDARFGLKRIRIMVFEPGVVELVPLAQQSGRSSQRSERERRLHLRAYAAHGADRVGTVASVRAAHDFSAYFR